MFSVDGRTMAPVEVVQPTPLPPSKERFEEVVSLDDVSRKVLGGVPMLIETQPKSDTMGTHVTMLKEFDLSQFCFSDEDRKTLLALLKCYYKRSEDIRRDLNEENLEGVFEDWDTSWVSPKLFTRLLPHSRAKANLMGSAAVGWFGRTDPVSLFLERAMDQWFAEDSVEEEEKVATREWKEFLGEQRRKRARGEEG